jgi:hypothetical protein
MGWEYHELPEALRVPPCSKCHNRGRVRQIVASLFLCLDCQPEHLFRAVWREESVRVLPARKAAAS